MDNKQNVKLNTYKDFYNKGIWNGSMLEFLKSRGFINEEEYNNILKKPKEIKDSRISDERPTYEIWNKKTPINGVPAEVILRDNSLKNASAIFLIKSPSTGKVIRIESKDIIMENNRLRSFLNTEQVAEFYLEQMEQIENTPQINYEQVNNGMQIYAKAVEIDQLEEIKKILIKNNDLLLNLKEILEER